MWKGSRWTVPLKSAEATGRRTTILVTKGAASASSAPSGSRASAWPRTMNSSSAYPKRSRSTNSVDSRTRAERKGLEFSVDGSGPSTVTDGMAGDHSSSYVRQPRPRASAKWQPERMARPVAVVACLSLYGSHYLPMITEHVASAGAVLVDDTAAVPAGAEPVILTPPVDFPGLRDAATAEVKW